MKFKFKIQQYQIDALEKTVTVFNGRPSYSAAIKYCCDLGKQQSIIRHEDGDAGFRNLDVEALKVPMFYYVWNRLYGYTHTLSPRGTSAYCEMERYHTLIWSSETRSSTSIRNLLECMKCPENKKHVNNK